MSNREIKTVLIGFSIILFFSLYYNISNSTKESTTADNIQAVVSIITLIVSIITIYFVYKAYQSQKEQINIQQAEIEDNRKDVEFNRALDIVYRQLEISLPLIKDNDYKVFKDIVIDVETRNEDIIRTLEELEFELYDSLRNIEIHISMFNMTLNNSKVGINDKEFLRILICTNLNSDFFNFLHTLRGFSSEIFNGKNTYESIINRILLINKKIE
ncbi:hypothetical protein [Sphingobacterium sp. 1.A.5]|uniref:hypothetical protein n=1 Tax=Sphingobacterium sp. 1.A.5 TaxID=2044604 RepID=UPI000C0BF312|nr:hypothetical protein [Sphingobacterium sp. 1.A.5]